MRITERHYATLEQRLDAALKANSFKEFVDHMGDYLNAETQDLPVHLQDRFSLALDRMVDLTITPLADVRGHETTTPQTV